MLFRSVSQSRYAVLDNETAIKAIEESKTSNVQTIIIIILSVIVVETSFRGHTKLVLQDYTEQVQQEKYLAEEYTKIIAPSINEYIEKILAQDKDASNVILLNYHNTLVLLIVLLSMVNF